MNDPWQPQWGKPMRYDLLLTDEARRTISAKGRLVTQLTLKDGRVWYERAAE